MRTWFTGQWPRHSGTPFIDLPPMSNRENQNDYVLILDLAQDAVVPYPISPQAGMVSF